MKRLLTLVAFFATVQASAQQVNPVPDYVFRNQMSVGRGTVTDTAAYFSIGPRYGANKGFMPPIVVDTATFSSGKRNGLLIFSVQKNKFLYWDSVRVQWSDMAGSSGTYITGTGITGYVPQFNGTTTLDTSALFTIGNRLGIGSSTFAYTSTNTANVELNGTAGGILGFKRNDSARGYLWHTGDNMELANTTAGSISFNTNSATRGSISSAGVWRLHNLAGTGDRVVVASSNGTLSASTSVTGLVDTTTISTRAWRQKGDDSLGAIIATKGSGTVTSVATGYGLSGGTITTSGTLLVDTLNISTRAWRQKGLDSLAALEVSGSGTTNYVPKFTAASTIGNSQIFDNGSTIGIGSTAGTYYVEAKRNGTADIVANSSADNNSAVLSVFNSGGTSGNFAQLRAYGNTTASTLFGSSTNKMISFFSNGDALMTLGTISGTPLVLGTTNTERLRIFSNGRIGINTTTDAGYQLDVNGTLRTVNGANFATTSGQVGIGTTTFVYSPKTAIASVGENTLAIQTTDIVEGSVGSVMYIGTSAATGNSRYGVIRQLSNGGTGVGNLVLNPTGGSVGIGQTSPSYTLDINGTLRSVNGANFATSSGNVGIGTTTGSGKLTINSALGDHIQFQRTGQTDRAIVITSSDQLVFGTWASPTQMALTNAGELLINTTTDAGDYKLQVSGNALVTAGKLDITTNTAFGLSVSRSGTSVVAGQINNSNGILYYGAESSTGGGLFTGSSAYAAVIGSGAAYPLQFATNNVTRATLNTDGELLINTLSDQGAYNLQINGSMYNTGQVTRGTINTIGTGAQLSTDSTTNIPAISINQSLTGASGQSLISATTTWNTTGNPSLLEFNVTNTASGATANYLRISDGTNIFRVTKDAGLFTSAPSGGTARKWKFGSAATVSPTSPNRTIQIEVDGVVYYLHAKTTND